MRFSASRADTYMSCGYRAWLKYHEQVPDRTNAKTTFGSVMHHVLEDVERRHPSLEDAKALFVDLWTEPEKLGLEHGRWPKFTNFTGLRDKGYEILDVYYEQAQWKTEDIIALEQKFLVPFGRHELNGFIDKLSVKKSGNGRSLLICTDYKTSSRKPTLGNLVQNLQFSCYMWATTQPEFWLGNGPDYPPVENGEWWMEMLKDMPRRAVWHHLWTGSELDAGDRDEADFGRLHRLLDQIERAIEAEALLPTLSGDTCTYCSYANGPCPTVIPTRQQQIEESTAWL